MTKDELLKLADRCEREEASRALDADMFETATGRRDFNKADKSFRERGSLLLLTEDDRLNWVYAPAYTTSLDAAKTLAPEGAATISESASMADGIMWRAVIGGGMACWARTEPMARCAAALRARASLTEKE